MYMLHALPAIKQQWAIAAGTEWVTGASDGSLAMWSQTKKRPTSVLRKAHGYPRPGLVPFSAPRSDSVEGQLADDINGLAEDEPVGPGSVGGDAASWIGAVGVCKGTDLVVSMCLAANCRDACYGKRQLSSSRDGCCSALPQTAAYIKCRASNKCIYPTCLSLSDWNVSCLP